MAATPSNELHRAGDYAPAAWEDGENIPEISLDAPQIPGKYKATISNILSKHCSEVKNASEEVIQPIVSLSKKKLRELITKHNNEIFAFLSHPSKTPNMLGVAETIFRRYGHDIPSIRGNTVNTILRDLNLDASMNNVISDFDEGLKKVKGISAATQSAATDSAATQSATTDAESKGGLDDFIKQTRWIYNQYKHIGEEVLRLETVLFQKIDLLDKLNNRIPLITSLTPNESLPELIESFTKYAETVYQSSNLEESYKELIEAYKKWNICRQIITLNSTFKTATHDAQCSICLIDAVSVAIVPCGHTFCGNCAKKQNTTCYICRGTIRERIKLYFT
jgi:hypothetical protein